MYFLLASIHRLPFAKRFRSSAGSTQEGRSSLLVFFTIPLFLLRCLMWKYLEVDNAVPRNRQEKYHVLDVRHHTPWAKCSKRDFSATRTVAIGKVFQWCHVESIHDPLC